MLGLTLAQEYDVGEGYLSLFFITLLLTSDYLKKLLFALLGKIYRL